jgi:ABC-type sugar transport system permease subunit
MGGGKFLTLEKKKSIAGMAFISPWILGFALFIAWPLFFSLFISFADVNPAGFTTRFIGLRNYIRAIGVDIEFLPLLGNTVLNVVLDTPIILVFSLSVAVLLTRNMKGQTLFRAIFFLPVVVSSGYVIKEFFNQGIGGLSIALGIKETAGVVPSELGGGMGPQTPNIINISSLLGEYLGPQIADTTSKFLSRLGLVLWRSGIQILLFIAGMHGISSSLYESGRIDGANEWTLFWMVTLPILSPVILASIIFTIVDSFTDVFNDVLHYIEEIAFKSAMPEFGYSAALSWIYFLTVFLIIIIVMIIIGRRVFNRGEK